RPEGYFASRRLDMSVEFECLADPVYTQRGQTGHFEQTGRVTGSISMDDETWEITHGYGVRDKSWGPRTWVGAGAAGEVPDTLAAASGGPQPFITWHSMNFGPDLALALVGGQDGAPGRGWYQKDGTNQALTGSA